LKRVEGSAQIVVKRRGSGVKTGQRSLELRGCALPTDEECFSFNWNGFGNVDLVRKKAIPKYAQT
jgi:hypothetical protein